MLRGATRVVVQRQPRPLSASWSQMSIRAQSSAAGSTSRAAKPLRSAGLAALATVAATAVYFNAREPVFNDAAPATRTDTAPKANAFSTLSVLEDDGHLRALVWGSNRAKLISPDTSGSDTYRTPRGVTWLRDVALRDLALHEQHGACIDARGDVYQWGEAFYGAEEVADADQETAAWKPKLSLRGKDIVSVQATSSRVFALSSSGKIYVLPAISSEPTDEPSSSWVSPSSWFGSSIQNCDFVELQPEQVLARREKFVSISTGNDHLLALTSSGRTYAHPLTLNANTYGQLGLRRFDVPARDHPTGKRVPLELIPKAVADPYAKSSPYERKQAQAPAAVEPAPDKSGLVNEGIRFCDKLYEVPSLRSIKIAQAVAGGRSSFVRTEEGRVLAWGANEYGQLGLGVTPVMEQVSIPTEVVFSRSVPTTTRSRCVDICTGGDLTFFIVERLNGTSMPSTDVLACGMGQWGALGNGLYTTAQSTPMKVRAVSGLLEYSEATQNLQAITPHALSVSPTGHVLLTLDTLSRAGPGTKAGGGADAVKAGRDLFVWGLNRDYQLGNGKRASLATPVNVDVAVGGSGSGNRNGNGGDAAGVSRLMLQRRKADVRDMSGRVWRRRVEVEQCAVAGYGSSLVYWRVV